ncbi:sperm flagellar protein 2 [Triplophysa dalaica]|uniref:sperm flagellar protein 2 n=1 Tax=Triplophysa dalaica TaxID=1582913 RepID=UPI0024E038E1|nr:sperm flagellar protein 2 [Triplophysa dalaica]
MSSIICEWLNAELRLSKVVAPVSLSRDFANGFLIGEILTRFELQDDFHLFSKHSTPNAKLNNFTRLEPTLHLLGVPFDLSMARAVMMGRQGAVTNLLYQLYIVLQKKKRSGLTATAMDVMQPAAAARLHRVEKHIYTERLKTVVRREADVKMQKIAKRFHKRGQDMYHQSIMTELQQEKERVRRLEERRTRDIEKHRQARRRQQDMMIQIQSAVIQIPKPPHSRSPRALEKKQIRKQHDAQLVRRDIAQFEKNQKWISPAGDATLLSSGHVMSTDEREQWNREYMENIRLRLEEDSTAREQREMRRRRALVEQLQAHQTQQEEIREEQMVKRLMRQTQQEKRIVVQLTQIKRQKEILRQNRIFQERQNQERCLQDLQQALDREAVLLREEHLERSEEIHMERQLHKRLASERAQARYQKHFHICRGILGQIVDLSTKVGEYRLLTDNLIPMKVMKEWMEMFLSGNPLYEVASVEPLPAEPTAEQIIELQKLQILNDQDYEQYVGLTGEWVWSEEAEDGAPRLKDDVLDHVVKRLKNMIQIPISRSPSPVFPRFTIRACVLGKTHTGKTSCLSTITTALGVRVLSAGALIQDVLTAHQQDKQTMSGERFPAEGLETPLRDEQDISPLNSGPAAHEPDTSGTVQERKDTEDMKRCLRAQRGCEVEKILMFGEGVPDQLLVDIIVDALRNVPADSGWVLDGFPVNIAQAVMLQNALSGTQSRPSAEKNTPDDPQHLSPALDVVVLLDVSDEQVLERASRRADGGGPENRDEDKQKSQEFISHIDRGGERDQIQHRISGFHDTWPKLEEWFGEKQNILVKICAESDEDVVVEHVETLLKDVMDSVNQGAAPGHSVSSQHGHTERVRPSETNSTSDERVYVDEPIAQEISQYLVPYWDNMCTSYETHVKSVMQNLRSERELIIHHLYDIRENFRQHLLTPDLKQEFVSSWQSDYNSVPDNIRDDEETKGELHQRLDDLRERLWDICDKRRDEAVQERAAVINDDWLHDHTALIINNYCTLTQTEVSRCQGVVYLLRDYYSGMNKALLPSSSCDSTRLPLLDVTWSENMDPETSNISSVSGPSEKQTKNAVKKDTEAEDTRKLFMFPLVTSRSSSNEISKQDLRRPDEKLLEEIYQTAISAVCAEVQRCEDEEEEEEDQHHTIETQRANTQSQASNTAKDRKKAAKQKGAPPPPSHEPSPQPAAEENPEEVKRRATRRRIRQEYTAALKHEERVVKLRLDVLKSHAVRMLCSLQQNTQELYTKMQEWMETRFLSEMSSVEQLTELVRRHIENGRQIRHELVLHAADFCVDGDTRVLASAPPTPPPPLLEELRDSTLTVQQLNIICAQLHKTAPSGVLSGTELTEVLQEFISPHRGCDDLPQPWTHMTSSQVVELVCAFTGDSEMLDWCQFVLSVALPWPFPSQTQLFKTLQRFRAVDAAGTGLITLEQYTQVELWFRSDKHHPPEALPYERLDNLKKFFFSLFASTHSSPVMLDYMKMLLYFCCHPEASQGFIRALGLVTEHTLHYKHTGPLVQSVTHLEGADVEELDADDVRGAEPDGEGVSVDDVLRVLSHGQNLMSAHPNRFHRSCRSRDLYREELLKVCKELDFKAEEKIPFSVLSQHPFLQDLIEASSQYLLVDVHKILQTQKNEEDCKS